MSSEHFKLETLLNLRKQKEEECERALAQALASLKRDEEALLQVRMEREELNVDWLKAITDPNIRCERIRDYEDYAQVLERSEIDGLARLRASKDRQRECAAALVKASRDTKILEKLKTRISERALKREREREQAQMDEMAMTRQSA